MVIQGENQKLSLHQALSLETLFADHLLLIAYEEEEDLVTEKNEIARKNGNQAAHEELMRSPGAPENLHINNNSPFTYKYHNSQKPYIFIDSENTSAEVNMGTITVSLTWKVPLKKIQVYINCHFSQAPRNGTLSKQHWFWPYLQHTIKSMTSTSIL
ncbi:hypothetical protein F2Q70_00020827 [Brassica cretica]|uniref:Uncharacterized protein n=1 Tax=Brassica cretica TaxID=69181 RepID=A0A8S9GJH5_BRACR|nr:hypothetical protein F2Q70_00020827 [Brassica cretica]